MRSDLRRRKLRKSKRIAKLPPMLRLRPKRKLLVR